MQDFISFSNLTGIDDPETITRPLANYLRPKLVDFWKQRRKALFTENAEKMKNLLDNLQKKLDEVSGLPVGFFLPVISI